MQHKIRVLLVEDHEDTLYAVAYALRRKGYDVLTAVDVRSGIAMGIEDYFDILVCDILLPDGFGWEVLMELRNRRSFPAIAVTGDAAEHQLASHREAGFDQALAKPFQLKRLVHEIDELIFSYGLNRKWP